MSNCRFFTSGAPSPRALPLGVAHSHRTYQPRDTEHSVLHAVIREYLEPFVREVTDRGDQRRDAPARFRGPPRCERPERCGRNARDRRRQPH